MTSKRQNARAEGIRVRALSKRFREVRALDGVDLDVAPGRITAVLGPNGAGKTTLLRILGTTVLPDDGDAWIDGHHVTTDPAVVRGSAGAVIGDERSFYWRLSGRQNLEFFGILQGLRRREARQRADDLLHVVGLDEAADRRFDGYSSGMKSRLSFARALLTDPPALLLDEPSRALDPIVAAEFRQLTVGRVRERGAAALLATHDLHEAASVADDVVVLHRGRVVARSPGGQAALELERLFLEAVRAEEPGT